MLAAKIGHFRAKGFDPRSISGLALWLDATDSSSYTVSTGVSEWRDKSGNSRHFTEAVGNNQPSLTTMNGRTSLGFNGTSQRLSRSTAMFTTLTGTSPFAFFMAVEGTFPGTAANLFNHRVASGGADDNNFNVAWFANNGSAWLFGTLRNRVVVVRSGVETFVDQRFDSVNVAGRGLYSLVGSFGQGAVSNVAYWNNVAAPSTAGTAATGNVAGMTIGCRNNATRDLFYTGKVGEIIAYAGSITTAQRLAVQNYLAAKWGVTLA